MNKILASTLLIGFALLTISPAEAQPTTKTPVPNLIDSNQLTSGSVLNGNTGQYLVSSLGKYYLRMQSDCNLVLYTSRSFSSGSAVWSTRTAGRGTNCQLRMQTDGNLVIYTGSNVAVWQSGTKRSGSPGYYVEMQNDRNIVIYAPGRKAQWASGTKA